MGLRELEFPRDVRVVDAIMALVLIRCESATANAANRTLSKIAESRDLAKDVIRFVREGGYPGVLHAGFNHPAEVHMTIGPEASRGLADELGRDVSTWARRIVDEAMANPPQEMTGTLSLAAHYQFDHRWPSHQCYWNDRFCLAVMLNLPWHFQQKAAWCAVNNGLTGYWEWITHSDYSMAQVFKHLHIEIPVGVDTKSPEYVNIHIETAKTLAERFELPSEQLRRHFKLDKAAEALREQLWEGYQYSENGRRSSFLHSL